MARQSERSETERQENFPSLVASTKWRSRSTGADQRPFSSQLLMEMPLLLTPSLTFGVQNCWRRCGVDSLLGVPGSSSLSGVNELYKKGCQEKKLRLDRRRDFFLEIQPTEV